MTSEKILDQLLDKAHGAILAANFAELAQTAQEMDHVISALDWPQSGPVLDRLRGKANRNLSCLTAARRGIKSAINRLNEVRRTANGLVTYNDKGKRSDLTANGQLIQRF